MHLIEIYISEFQNLKTVHRNVDLLEIPRIRFQPLTHEKLSLLLLPLLI